MPENYSSEWNFFLISPLADEVCQLGLEPRIDSSVDYCVYLLEVTLNKHIEQEIYQRNKRNGGFINNLPVMGRAC